MGLMRRREFLAGGLAGLMVRPAHAEVPFAFKPGDFGLVSAETERGLVQAVAIYRQLAANGGWPSIEAASLQVGDNDDRVVTLRRRLRLTGDLPPGGNESLFDGAVRDAVVRFQMRHGIASNGRASGITLAHMNVSAADRAVQLEANLGRLRELLTKIGRGRHIVMNAPSFELQAVGADGRVQLVSKVIVGKRATPTPVVSAVVQAVDLLPYWHVPSTIAFRDLVPTIRKDPAYLPSRKIRVYSSFGGEEIDPAVVNWAGPEVQRYVFRQDPGPQNALGFIRLDMPNREIVYMHDTPTKELFVRDERAYSAGCVRVQSIYDLATWVIGGAEGWSRAKLEEATANGKKSTIRLPQPVPVHFSYLTAWEDNGLVHFRNDLYNRDAAASALSQTADAGVRAPFQSIAP